VPPDTIGKDLAELLGNGSGRGLDTDTIQLVLARLGQGKFREDVLSLWGNSCAVTGSTSVEALRASHIKPWRDSDSAVRRDPSNGLPLVATLDALFDRGLIGFSAGGKMIVSDLLSNDERKLLGVPGSLRHKPSQQQARYLRYHAKHVFRRA